MKAIIGILMAMVILAGCTSQTAQVAGQAQDIVIPNCHDITSCTTILRQGGAIDEQINQMGLKCDNQGVCTVIGVTKDVGGG